MDWKNYEPTIGLEVHIQLSTESKIFCDDLNRYGSDPNTNIGLVSLAHPGTLPVLNQSVIEYGLKMAIACNCKISQRMFFDRKNYFYPDLPKGYQLTQDKTPIGVGGSIDIISSNGKELKVELTKIHLEEDAGKLIHLSQGEVSQVDFNRAGVPLIELVTEPIIHDPEDASILLQEIRDMVRYLEVSSGDMEKGSLRCDANISVAKAGQMSLGNKVEIKNMNSFRHVKQAITHEIERQIDLLEKGKDIISETRLYNVDTGLTEGMRTKEALNDYRYFPEPDLCPFEVSDQWLAEVKASMPKLGSQWQGEFVKHGLTHEVARILTESKPMAEFYDNLVRSGVEAKPAANWLVGPVKSYLNSVGKTIDKTSISIDQMSGLIALVAENRVSFSIAASELLPKLFDKSGADPEVMAEELDLIIGDDSDELTQIIIDIMNEFPEKVTAYRNGKKGLLGMFMGEVMKKSGGKVDPKKANDFLREALNP